MTEIRQAAAIEQKPEAKAEPKPDPRPEAKAEPKPTPAPAQPVVRAPVQQAVQVPATVVAAPQAAAVVDDQRVAKGLALAADYMQSGRVVNARSLLEDLAKSGNPTVLATLAESYDPLHLRSTYPKLFRTGSFAKALDAYERAKAAGAKGMEPRIEAVRAVMNARP